MCECVNYTLRPPAAVFMKSDDLARVFDSKVNKKKKLGRFCFNGKDAYYVCVRVRV